MQCNTNVMVTVTNNTSASVKIDGEPLKEVSSIKHMLATLWNYGICNSETRTDAQIGKNMQEQHQLSDHVQALQVAGRIHLRLQVWDWTLLVKAENSSHAFEKECFLNFPRISFWENKTNDYVQLKVTCHVGRKKPLRVNVKRRNMALVGHLTQQNSLCKTITHGSVEGGRKHGQPC